MKKPYIANYMEEKTLRESSQYYDGKTQISYEDKTLLKKVIESLEKSGRTTETRRVEDSDPDEYLEFGRTKTTFTTEDDDEDSMYLMGKTYITEAEEDSDPDELQLMGSTIETAAVEDSDTDNIFLS